MEEVKAPSWDETAPVESAPKWDDTAPVEPTAEKKSSVDTSQDGFPVVSYTDSELGIPSTSPAKPFSEPMKILMKKHFLDSPIYDNPKTREVYYNSVASKGYDKEQLKQFGETVNSLKPFLPEIIKRVTENPDDTQAMYQLGRAQLALGETGGAINTFTNLVAKEPRQSANYQGLAYALKLSGDDKGAQQVAARAKELAPDQEPGNAFSGAINPPQQHQDAQGMPISEDHSSESFATPESERLKTIAAGIEQFTPVLSTASGTINSFEDAQKSIGELHAAAQEGVGATILKTAEAAMHGIFGLAQASPAGLLFNSGVQTVQMAGGEKPLEYIFEPATKIAQATGYVPKSMAAKSWLAIGNAVGSLLILESPHLAMKLKGGTPLTEHDVQEIRSTIESKPEVFQEELKKAVVSQEPEETQKLKEKQIGLRDDLNKNLPELGETAAHLFGPEIDKLQEKIDTKTDKIAQEHTGEAADAALGNQIDEEVNTLSEAKANTTSPEGIKILDDKIDELKKARPKTKTETAPVPEPQIEIPTANAENDNAAAKAKEAESLLSENGEVSNDKTGGEPEQPSESPVEPPVIKTEEKVEPEAAASEPVAEEPVVTEPAAKPSKAKKAPKPAAEPVSKFTDKQREAALKMSRPEFVEKKMGSAKDYMEVREELINESKKNSELGFGGSPKIETFKEAKVNEPVKASDIIKKISSELGVPIRTGNVRWGKRLGIFKQHDEVVRNKEGNDLAVTSHEVAHFIDKKFKPDLRNKDYRDELKDLDYDKTKRRNFEGFAEFVRHYLTGDEADTHAPKFHDYFANKFLPEHPELNKTIVEAKKLITKWREQGAESRMISEIDWDGSGKRKISFGERMRQARSRWIDQLGPIKYAMDEMLGSKVKDLRPADNPYELAQAGNKAAAAKARSFVMDGVTDFSGEKIYKGLKEIVSPVTKEIKPALAYTRAMRNVNRAEKNADVNPNVLEDARYIVDKYKNNEAFNTFAKEVTGWNGKLIEYLADAGRISDETKDKILDSDLIYIPFKHAVEQGEGGGSGVSKALLSLGVPLKRFNKKGGDIINPLEAMMQNAEKIIATADKNRVVNSLVDIAENNEGLGKWVEKVAAPQVATKSVLKKLQGQLEGLGADLSEADMDGMLTLFSNAPGYFGKDNIGVLYRKGKPQFYEFHPELFNALKGMDSANMAWFTNTLLGKAVTGVTKLTRLGATGIRAGFQLISNPIRDTWTASLQSEYNSHSQPLRSVKGIIDALGNSESHRMFKALGGETAQPLGMDRKFTQNLTREILADDAKSKAMNVIKSPIEMIRKVLSFPEAGVRMGEFESVMKKYQPKIDQALANGDMAEVKKIKEDRAVEAANAANEVTVNFKRMGGYTSVLNQIIFGFNPAIQGLSKMGRSIYDHPVRSTLRGAAYLTAPTLALWALNKDEEWYKQLKPWERYAFWHFKIHDTIYKLPKPFEWGYVFGGIPEGVANSLYNDDNYYMKNAVTQAAQQLTPNIIPDAVKAPAELYFNWDMFRSQPVVPTSEENLLPPLQYLPQTSSVAKELGEILNVAPIKIDFLLNGYTGGLAGDILNGFHKDYKEKADLPVIGRLFVRQSDALLNGDYVQRFYDMADQATKIHTSVKAYPKMKENPSMDEMKKMLRVDDEAVRLYSSYDQINQIKKSLQELRVAQKRIEVLKISADVKTRAIEELGSAAVKLVTPVVTGHK